MESAVRGNSKNARRMVKCMGLQANELVSGAISRGNTGEKLYYEASGLLVVAHGGK
jgi:hypothetical protein